MECNFSAFRGINSKGGIPVDFPDFTRGQWIKFREEKIFALDEQFPMVPERFLKY